MALHHPAPPCTSLHHSAWWSTNLNDFAPSCKTLHNPAQLCTNLHHEARTFPLHHPAPLCNPPPAPLNTTLHHTAPPCTILQHHAEHQPELLCTFLHNLQDAAHSAQPCTTLHQPAHQAQTSLYLPVLFCISVPGANLHHPAPHCTTLYHLAPLFITVRANYPFTSKQLVDFNLTHYEDLYFYSVIIFQFFRSTRARRPRAAAAPWTPSRRRW